VTTLAILIKSHRPDVEYAARLLESIRVYNAESIPVFLVVPPSDVDEFTALSQGVATVLSETELHEHLVQEPVAGFSAGYINQEIVKLSFWELGLADNYLCMDSDAEFIRPLSKADFMANSSTPFTFLTEDADLRSDPQYFADTWRTRGASLDRIKETIGYEGTWPLTVHGHAVFSATALRSFRDDFLAPREWDYVDALAISPYEPSWYNAWVLHARPIEVIRREPIIKTFHTPTQHLEYVLRGVTEEDVARGFVAVVVNSNYSRGEGVVPLTEAPHMALASYVSGPDLLRAMGYRVKHVLTTGERPTRKLRRSLGRLALSVPGLRRFVDTGQPRD
jgi:hypothetical protein